MNVAVKNSLLVTVALLLGILIGTNINVDQAVNNAQETKNSKSNVAKSDSRDLAKSTSRSEFLEMRKRLKNGAERPSVSEIQKILESFVAAAGLNRLSFDETDKLSALIQTWYRDHPEDVMAWIFREENANNRSFFLQSLVKVEVEKGANEAISFVEKYMDPNEPWNLLGNGFFQKMIDTSPDALIRALKASIAKNDIDNSRYAENVQYPQSFDFAEVLSKLSKLADGMGENECIKYAPGGLLLTWSERDPQAAYEWIVQSSQKTGDNYRPQLGLANGFMSDLFEGYAKVANPKDYAAFIDDIAANPISGANHSRILWDAFYHYPASGSREEYMNNLSSNNPIMVDTIFRGSVGNSGSEVDRQRLQMMRYVSFDLRLSFLTELNLNQRDAYQRELISLGHTQQQIDQVLDGAKQASAP